MGRLNSPNYTVFIGLIAFCVMIGSIVLWWLRRDLEEDTPVTDEDVLHDLERAYFAGEMDRAEFERVTASLRGVKSGAADPQPPVQAVTAPDLVQEDEPAEPSPS